MRRGAGTAMATVAEPAKEQELSRDEGYALLDRQARRYLNMSADEFLQAWESGQFGDNPDRPEVMRVAMLINMVR